MNRKIWIRFGILALGAVFLLILLAYAGSKRQSLDLPAAPAQSGDADALQPVTLTDEQGEYPLGLHLEILEDPGGALTIDDVSSPAYEAQFAPSQVEAPTYGFTDSVYWVRFRLDNQTRLATEWLLEVDFANTHYVDLYSPVRDGQGFEVKQSGTLRPVSTRDVFYPNIVFDLSVPTLSRPTYYLRFQNGASMSLGLTLWEKDAFSTYAQQQNLLRGLFFGALIGLLTYNLLLLSSLRERSYLYLLIEMAAAVFFVATYDDLTQIYLISKRPDLATYILELSWALMFIAIVLFADHFLEAKRRRPILHRINLVIVGVWGVGILLTPFISYRVYTSWLAAPWALVTMTVMLVEGTVSYRGNFRPPLLFLGAWSGLFLSLAMVILARMGTIVSLTPLVENLFRLGMVGTGVLWSFTLAYRINVLQTETRNVNQELRHSEHRLSQILESMPLGVVLYGKDTKPRYINRRTIELLSDPIKNVRPDPAAGRTLLQAIQYFSFRVAGSRQEYPLDTFPPYQALQGETASADDIEVEQGDKQLLMEVWASPIRDEAGNVESAVVAFQDITRRKQAEARLAETLQQLELLVERRTTELEAANKDLQLRLEWMSAIVFITEIMARSTDLTQIYDKIIEIINRLIAVQDSFIAELDEGQKRLKILAHSCRSENHAELIGSHTMLPEGVLSDPDLAAGRLVFLSGEQLGLMGGPMGLHIQVAELFSVALVPLQLREQVFGFLGVELGEAGRAITIEEASLLRVFSTDIAQLIENSRLFGQAMALITAEERNRLARDLHDSVTQTLFTASVLAEATPRIWDKDQGIARQNMEKLNRLIRGALAEMRSMLLELRSDDLQNQSLGQLILTLVEGARARSHAAIILSLADIPDLPQKVTMAFYRIAREALNNALVHAGADQIEVGSSAAAGRVTLYIRDDGSGFDPQALNAGYLGIRIMHERAAEIGGEVQIKSAPGCGTEVSIAWSDRSGGLAENE